ncbi:MAG TPA: LamG-like jellyroll fold domain-containing protein [Armatimonadota bacterium]|nr:LamG-like jellyroll fold domain-containing protein [Armatimonadota bacterium]
MIADGEGKGDQTLNPKTYDNIAYSAKNFTMRHQGKYAAAFADGHVEMRSDPAWKFATKLWMDAAKIPSSATIDNYITSGETWPNSSIDPDYASNKVVGGGGYGFMNYSSTGMNGQPGVQGGWSRAGASSYTGPVRTVVCACTLLASGGYQSLCGAKPSNTNFESAYILGTANGYLRFDVDAVTGTISCWAPQSLVDPNHVFVLAGRIGNGKIELFLNGKRVASNTYTTQIADPDPAGPAFIVGNYSASGDSTKCTNGWAGYLGDAVLFDTTIGDAELQDVTNYLKAKYAVGKEKDQ